MTLATIDFSILKYHFRVDVRHFSRNWCIIMQVGIDYGVKILIRTEILFWCSDSLDVKLKEGLTDVFPVCTV